MPIIRKRLNPLEGISPSVRVVDDVVEVSPDGGATWIADPSADPRISPAFLLPPNTETDPKCAAAAGMVVSIMAFVDALSVGVGLLAIAHFFLLIALSWIPIPFLWLTAIGTADLILTQGASAVQAAFSSTVQEQLQCIFYCATDEDGRFTTQAQLDQARTQIGEDIGGVVTIVTEAIFALVGFVGMSNAGVVNADPSADCSECDECGWEVIITPDNAADYGLSIIFPDLDVFSCTNVLSWQGARGEVGAVSPYGNVWKWKPRFNTNGVLFHFTKNIPAATTINKLLFNILAQGGGAASSAQIFLGGTRRYCATSPAHGNLGVGSGLGVVGTGSMEFRYIWNVNNTLSQPFITQITIGGTGQDPFLV